MSIEDDEQGFVSTGRLPDPGTVTRLVDAAYEAHRLDTDGRASHVYPALAAMREDLFGICLVGTSGRVYAVGDCDHPFTIMSVSKPFVFGLVAQALGTDVVRDRVGANSTGLPFDSLDTVEQSSDGRTNPMVNAGAIATTSLVPGATPDERWQVIVDGLSRFAGRRLSMDEEVLASASATNHRNRELASALAERGRIDGDPTDAVDLYTRQCCLQVTARDLAVMGATLADGGRNPITGDDVVDPMVCHATLAVMATAGLYETSGDWLYDIGLPGKSGIGGGIITVSPGKGGLATFAPPLDEAGNSVKGQAVTRDLAQHLGMDLLISRRERVGEGTWPATP